MNKKIEVSKTYKLIFEYSNQNLKIRGNIQSFFKGFFKKD